jgi:small conductance mechanosensitive channel
MIESEHLAEKVNELAHVPEKVSELIHSGLLQHIYELVITFGIKLLIAIAILVFAKFMIKYLVRMIKIVLEKREVDGSIISFLSSLTRAFMWLLFIIVALSTLGIQTTSFIAVLGAVGLAVGLALQGSLSNFAAGFLIILFRPFRIGDLVEVTGTVGIIRSINMFSTEMLTTDNRKIVIPNSQIMNGVITNITAETHRRVDFVFRVSLDSDITKVKSILHDIISKHELVVTDDSKPIFIRMSAINPENLDFTVRCWSLTSDYWTVFFDINEQTKIEFDKNNITIPLPQMVVTTMSKE